MVGAVHSRSMVVCPSAVAVRPVGAPGAVTVGVAVVAVATLDAVPVPTVLIALTR